MPARKLPQQSKHLECPFLYRAAAPDIGTPVATVSYEEHEPAPWDAEPPEVMPEATHEDVIRRVCLPRVAGALGSKWPSVDHKSESRSQLWLHDLLSQVSQAGHLVMPLTSCVCSAVAAGSSNGVLQVRGDPGELLLFPLPQVEFRQVFLHCAPALSSPNRVATKGCPRTRSCSPDVAMFPLLLLLFN